MIARLRFSWFLCALVVIFGTTLSFAAAPVFADAGHARIIRLSLVQGDVRFTRDAHGDPLTESKNLWENAVLNLPIREGYVLSTDHGRAAVEFENGAMAFLNENTVLEFYDLSVDNGARTTRLILRQGAASFYVNSGNGDYFSVTGGDFTAEATPRSTFRLDNFDDGSELNVIAGHVSVVRKSHTTAVGKGESFSITAADGHINLGNLPRSDDFDRWVSARIESAVAATNAGLQYANGSSYYTSGFGDLYTYGSWFPTGAYGYGWQPFGAGLGWSPFDSGGWFMDSAFGWGFIGNQPWGWLPYHFGGWIVEPGIGWVWVPGNFGYGGYTTWRPATVAWVHLKTGPIGIVPSHPLDVPGKTSTNLAHGVFPISTGAVSSAALTNSGEWKVEKAPPRDAFSSSLAASARPSLVSRTMLGGAGNRIVTGGNDSRIIYDAREHRFVNARAGVSSDRASNELQRTSAAGGARNPSVAEASAARRTQAAAARGAFTPAPSPAERNAEAGAWGGARSSSSGTVSPATSSPARSSSGTSSGGRPH
jgi:hypothetical protein